LCVAALREGLLSLDQIAPIARRVPWWADEEFCRRAQMMTVTQIGRLASKYPFITDIAKPDGSDDALNPEPEPEPDGAGKSEDESDSEGQSEPAPEPDNGHDNDTPDEPAPANTVWFGYDDNGRFRMHVDLDAATGSIIENALTEARDSLFQHGDQHVDWADALQEVAQRSLDTVTSPQRRTRFHTHVHVDATSGVTDARGCGVDQQVADYMTCDGLRTEVFEVNRVPISVGRTQRIVPERTRRTVIHRDGGCRVPGCDDHRWLDVHHIVHWANNGPTDTDNLIALCGKHHRTHHQGRLGITGNADDPDGVTFTNRYGIEIRASGARPMPPGPRSTTKPPASTAPVYKPALRERMNDWDQHFNLPEGHRHRWSPYTTAS